MLVATMCANAGPLIIRVINFGLSCLGQEVVHVGRYGLCIYLVVKHLYFGLLIVIIYQLGEHGSVVFR